LRQQYLMVLCILFQYNRSMIGWTLFQMLGSWEVDMSCLTYQLSLSIVNWTLLTELLILCFDCVSFNSLQTTEVWTMRSPFHASCLNSTMNSSWFIGINPLMANLMTLLIRTMQKNLWTIHDSRQFYIGGIAGRNGQNCHNGTKIFPCILHEVLVLSHCPSKIKWTWRKCVYALYTYWAFHSLTSHITI